MDDATLWLLLMAAANPFRFAGAVPASSHHRVVVAVGAAVAAGLVVGGVVAGADAIRGALDLSSASTLLAVALVAVVTGLHDVVVRPAVTVTDRPTTAAATLAAVALLRPVVVLAAFGAGTAGGAVASSVVAIGALVATAWTATSRTSPPWAHAAGRLTGGALVLLGVDLGVDAVFMA